MTKLGPVELLTCAQLLIDWFDELLERQGGQLTLEEFIEEIELYRKREIVWGPTASLEPTTAGLTALVKGKYWLGYDEKLPEPLVKQTVIHELVHILKGDVDHQGALAVKRENDRPNIDQIKCEVYSNEENEQLVEFIAACIAEKILLKPPKKLNSTMRNWFQRKEKSI